MASLEASGETTPSYFTRDLTVIIDVGDNKAVKPEILIDSIELHCGRDDVVAACVPKSGNLYEVTLKNENCIEYLRDGVEVKGKQFDCQELVSKFRIVSIMNLSCYVTDEEINKQFTAIGVEIVSEIRRHCYKGTTVADGTRIMKVKLPDNMVSLPYSMKFHATEKDFAYYRVIHNDQKKVCSKCFSADHMYKECPSYLCYACDEQGHVKKNCPYPVCSSCELTKSKCKCDPSTQSGFTFNHGFNLKNKRKIDDDSKHGGKRPYGEAQPEGQTQTDQPPDQNIDENEVPMNSDTDITEKCEQNDLQSETHDYDENDMNIPNENSTVDGDDEFLDCDNSDSNIESEKIEFDGQGESDGFSMGDSNSSTLGENGSSQSSSKQKHRKKKKKGSLNKVKVNSHDG